MRYSVKEEDIIIKKTYESFTPCRISKKDDGLFCTYTKQVLCRKSVSLYVDNVELYKNLGGRCGDYIEEFDVCDYPSWFSLTGIQTYIMPFYTVNMISKSRQDGFKDYKLIIENRQEEDLLTVDVENCIFVDSDKGLNKVVSISFEYYKSWNFNVDINKAEELYDFLFDTISRQIENANSDSDVNFAKQLLHPSGQDSHIVQLAKCQDCYFILSLWHYVKGNAKLPTLKKCRMIEGDYSYYNGVVDYFIPQLLYTYEENKIDLSYSEQCKIADKLNGEEWHLNSVTDREWAEHELRNIRVKWFENGIMNLRRDAINQEKDTYNYLPNRVRRKRKQ